MEPLKRILDIYGRAANPEVAVGMKKYMKNQFEFLGLPRPIRSSLHKEWKKEVASSSASLDHELIWSLWQQPHREYQYIAMDLLIDMKSVLKTADLELIERLILTKPWWDTTDVLASHIVGHILQQDPNVKDTHIRPWSMHDSIWLKRTSIISQLKFKKNTDVELLTETILRNHSTDEFFLNKAIGWALREYSKTNKAWVKAFLKDHTLKPLSIREGSKYV